jgi:hypothetical protein
MVTTLSPGGAGRAGVHPAAVVEGITEGVRLAVTLASGGGSPPPPPLVQAAATTAASAAQSGMSARITRPW